MAGLGTCTNGFDVKPRSGISCEECGLKFDSHTSLEVHLAYHKENLLDRWRQQDRAKATDLGLLGASSSLPAQQIQVSDQTRGVLDLNAHLDLAMDRNGHNVIYLPSYYRNNVQFHNTNNIPSPYSAEMHGFYNGGHNHDGSIHTLQIPHPNTCLTATDLVSLEMEHHNKLEKMSTDAAAEILDLDSNTVHVVNHNHNSGHSGAEHPDRGEFYRPFLNGGPSTPPAPAPTLNLNCSSNWGSVSVMDQESGIMKSYPHAPPPAREHMPISSNQNPVYSQPQLHSLQPAQESLHPHPRPALVPDVKAESSRGQGSVSVKSILSEQLMAEPSNSNSAAEKDLERTPSAYSTSETAPPNSKPVSSTAKVKGWKGGECKRPKTYNCTACNKWFTSSGHLKRHYGTTLHKNSIRQLGEDGIREPGSNPPQKGPAAKGKRNSVKKNGVTNAENEQKERPSPAPANRKEVIGNGRDNFLANSNGGIHMEHIPHDCSDRANCGKPGSPEMQTSSSSGSAAEDKFQLEVGKSSQNSVPMPSNANPGQFEEMGQMPYNSYSYPPNANNANVATSFSPSIGHSIPPPVGVGDNGLYGSGGGYSVLNGINGGLPPFSSVGYSHYDPSIFPHLNANLGQHYPSLGSSRATYYTSSPMAVTSQFPNLVQGPKPQQSHADNRHGHDSGMSGSPEPEVARAATNEFDCNSFENESASNIDSNSPSMSMSSDESPGDEQAAAAAVFRCSECPKTFGRGCYLTQHMNSSHAGLPFKCSTCGKKFIEVEALAEHARKHGGDKPFRCEHDQCLKQFNHKTDLRRHLCLHTGEKPFICKTCGKGFIRKDHMNKHTETHRKKMHQSR